MNKYLLTIATLVAIGYSVESYPWAKGGIKPHFTGNGDIELAAQGGLCGGFTIKVKRDVLGGLAGSLAGSSVSSGNVEAIKLVAYKVTKPPFAPERTGDEIGSIILTNTNPKRFRYDWAGINKYDRYRINCYVGTTATYRQTFGLVPCESVVEISGIKHNRGCVGGPAGPQADYKPLNMNKG